MTLAIIHGEDAQTLYTNLRTGLRDAVEKFPEGCFLHATRSGEFHEQAYREVLTAAEGLAAALHMSGLRSGDGLILNLRDSKKFISALWAAILGGFIAVPLTESAVRRLGADQRKEIFNFVTTALNGAFILTDDPDLHADVAPKLLLFDELAREGKGLASSPESDNCNGPRLAVLTSGTTARPKLVALNEAALLARWWPKLHESHQTSVFLSWSPFDHVMGLSLAAPNLERKAYLDAEFFAACPLTWLDAVERSGATHATMTNFGLSLVLQALKTTPHGAWNLSSLRRIGIGAESVSASLCASFLDLLVPYGLREEVLMMGYGLTECGPVVGVAFSRDKVQMDAAVLDRPTAGHSVRIVGEDSIVLNEGKPGRIEVRGPTMTTGYISDPEATAAMFTPDGWLRTGDLGSIYNGRLSITGREKELIVVNAKKYSCHEIENSIAERSRFKEVFAVPLDDDGTPRSPLRGKPFAIVVAVARVEDYDPDKVTDEIRRTLAAVFFFVPEIVTLIASSAVPRTALGKIQRSKLVQIIVNQRFAASSAELCDIESVLNACDGVQQSVVLLHQQTAEDELSQQLVAYVVPKDSNSPVNERGLRTTLTEILPLYMIPSLWIMLEALPLNVNGKIDRQQLMSIALNHQAKKTFIAPDDFIEKELVSIWEKVLQVHPISMNDDFFELGGDSLLAIRLVHEIQKTSHHTLPINAFFQFSTVREMANKMKSEQDTEIELSRFSQKRKTYRLSIEEYKILLAVLAGTPMRPVRPGSLMVTMNTKGTQQPLFWCGNGYQEQCRFSEYLGHDRPLYVMYSGVNILDKLDSDTKMELANYYVEEIRSVQTKGPYLIGGNCTGAAIASQIALQLLSEGDEVEKLCLMEYFTNELYNYPGQMLLLYGRESSLKAYEPFRWGTLGWEQAFKIIPQVEWIPGVHGSYFSEPNIQGLIEKLFPFIGITPQPALFP